jgi:hypothetical protein
MDDLSADDTRVNGGNLDGFDMDFTLAQVSTR